MRRYRALFALVGGIFFSFILRVRRHHPFDVFFRVLEGIFGFLLGSVGGIFCRFLGGNRRFLYAVRGIFCILYRIARRRFLNALLRLLCRIFDILRDGFSGFLDGIDGRRSRFLRIVGRLVRLLLRVRDDFIGGVLGLSRVLFRFRKRVGDGVAGLLRRLFHGIRTAG